MTAEQISARAVQIGRRWIGTPYHHQASVEGLGCDCLGLLRGIWREILGSEPAPVPFYSFDWGEAQKDEVLLRAATEHLMLKPLSDEQAGDVLLFRMRDGAIAKHLGIQTETEKRALFVHAYDRHGVIESPLSAPWRRRIVARFSFPEETH